jgi:hypothetical protein
MKGASIEAPFIVRRVDDVSANRRCLPNRPSWSHSSHRSDFGRSGCRPDCRSDCRIHSSCSIRRRIRTSPTPTIRRIRTSPIPMSWTRIRCGRSGCSDRSFPSGSCRPPARPRRTDRASCLHQAMRRRESRPATTSQTVPDVPTNRTSGRPASLIGPTIHSVHPGSRLTSPSSCRDRSSGEAPSSDVDPRAARPPHRTAEGGAYGGITGAICHCC